MSSRERRLSDEEQREQEEEELVREVLREFPPEERGEREEWKDHVGWHRRENIRKRVVVGSDEGVHHVPNTRDAVGDLTVEGNLQLQNKSEGRSISPENLPLRFLPLLIFLPLLLVVSFIVSKSLCRRSKHRTL